jgi:hypothetical protein
MYEYIGTRLANTPLVVADNRLLQTGSKTKLDLR